MSTLWRTSTAATPRPTPTTTTTPITTSTTIPMTTPTPSCCIAIRSGRFRIEAVGFVFFIHVWPWKKKLSAFPGKLSSFSLFTFLFSRMLISWFNLLPYRCSVSCVCANFCVGIWLIDFGFFYFMITSRVYSCLGYFSELEMMSCFFICCLVAEKTWEKRRKW